MICEKEVNMKLNKVTELSAEETVQRINFGCFTPDQLG